MTNVTVTFRNFAKAPKEDYLQNISYIAENLNQPVLKILFEINIFTHCNCNEISLRVKGNNFWQSIAIADCAVNGH